MQSLLERECAAAGQLPRGTDGQWLGCLGGVMPSCCRCCTDAALAPLELVGHLFASVGVLLVDCMDAALAPLEVVGHFSAPLEVLPGSICAGWM